MNRVVPLDVPEESLKPDRGKAREEVTNPTNHPLGRSQSQVKPLTLPKYPKLADLGKLNL